LAEDDDPRPVSLACDGKDEFKIDFIPFDATPQPKQIRCLEFCQAFNCSQHRCGKIHNPDDDSDEEHFCIEHLNELTNVGKDSVPGLCGCIPWNEADWLDYSEHDDFVAFPCL
jgi:hypothetical protein